MTRSVPLATTGPAARAARGETSPAPPKIRFGARKKYGANWEAAAKGLRITRLKEGPLRDAGIVAGDIFVSVDGKAATDELMLAVRGRVLSGEEEKVAVVVLRGRNTLLFDLRK